MASPDAALREGVDLRKLQLGGDPSSSPSPSISARLREALSTCSKSLEDGDYSGSEKAVTDLVDLLNGIVQSPPSVPGEALSEIHGFLSSPSADPMTVDALSLELPKVVVKFAGVSDKCREFVEKIVDCLITACNPRDILSMLCEVVKLMTILDYVIKCYGRLQDMKYDAMQMKIHRFYLLSTCTGLFSYGNHKSWMTGEMNQKRLLTEANVRKPYTEWLLPLRTLMSGIESENKTDDSELAFHTLCTLNPVQVVLYRCIELVEGYLEHPN